MSSTAGGTTASAWHDEIVAAFQLRIGSQAGAYEVVAVSIDDEYLRYFDRMLEEMALHDRRLPHPRNRDRTLLRSAAAEVILPTFLRGRKAEGGPTHPLADADSAMAGDLYNVFLGGLMRRMDPERHSRFAAVELLVSSDVAISLDDEIRRTGAALLDEDRDWYLGDGFRDFRSSFIEAALVTWMILHRLVAEEAVPDRHSFARLDAQPKASRRRRGLRLLA